ncbi:MAG: DUF6288 domain-containing protein [Akkermansiaceae bacterium]|jgi:hypothetical protein
MKTSCLLTLSFFAILFLPQSTLAGSGKVGDKRPYPAFQVGVTGASVRIDPGLKMIVDQIKEGSPAAGQLEKGDLVLSANGRAIEGPDPRVPLGTALTEAEAKTGQLKLQIKRGDKVIEAVVTVPVLGEYAVDWPKGCKKSAAIIAAHIRHMNGIQTKDGWIGKGGGLNEVMGALFLLSTGNPAYDESLLRYAQVLSASVEKNPSGSTWHLGYHLIFLCEYYIRTGKEFVLPAVKIACEKAAKGQSAGAWGHGFSGVSVGYVQSGLMNSAGVTLFLGMTLARECGITVHEEAWQKSLVFFYRTIGHGSIPYGDHRAEIYPDTNGRNAAIACAMSLLDGEVYQAAAQHLAMMVADSYASFEAGHTGGGFNVLWRGIALSHLPDTEMAVARRRNHNRQLAWYYDLCRLPEGGFSMLPSPPGEKRYTGEAWGRGLGLTYTAPMRSLRITGAPRSKHSKPTPPLKKIPWGVAADPVFLSSAHAEGFGEDTMLGHKAQGLVESNEPTDAATLARLLRHFNPYIRTRAAWKLGAMNSEEAYAAIDEALKHADPRVRRAGFDAISQYHHWSRGTAPKISKEIVSKRFITAIEKTLADANSPWWEIDGAFGALRAALPADIRRNRPHIDRFGKHEQWYLRDSSYWALIGLGKDITGPEFLELAARYNRSISVFERSSMNGGIEHLVRRERVELDEETVARYVLDISSGLHDSLFEAGYEPFAARQEAAHRTMMIIADFKNPPYRKIASQLAKYLADWEPGGNQHANWLITGNRWQPGLVKTAEELGKDAGPLVRQFERCLALDSWDLKPNSRNPQIAVREAMEKAVAHYKSLK